MKAVRRVVAILAVTGALMLVGVAPGGAAPPDPSGKGTALCYPATGTTVPRGGPLYGFGEPPPASDRAFELICGLPE